MVQGEGCDSERDREDNQVFVQRIALAEYGQIEKHNRKKFARFGENESQVVYMRQAGVAKGRCERRGDADED